MVQAICRLLCTPVTETFCHLMELETHLTVLSDVQVLGQHSNTENL